MLVKSLGFRDRDLSLNSVPFRTRQANDGHFISLLSQGQDKPPLATIQLTKGQELNKKNMGTEKYLLC